MITIESKVNDVATQNKYPNTLIVDVSSKKNVLNSFYPHKGIRVPFTDGYCGISIAAIWNSLMVFEDVDVDMELRNVEIETLKREHYGRFIGLRQGYFNNYIMDVVEARKKILIPMYRWMLEQKVFPVIQKLREIMQQRDIVLLDDSVNCDIGNINHSLSHAWLIKSYVEGLYPYEDVFENIIEYHLFPKKGREWTTTNRVLKEIRPDYIGGQLKLGLN